MCVVERRTYIRPEGRRQTIETRRLCHNAVGSSLCDHVEYRNAGVARVVDASPSTMIRRSDEIVTIGRDGRPNRYHPISSSSGRRSSYGRPTADVNLSTRPRTSPSSPRPILNEIRPPAPSPPATSTSLPSTRWPPGDTPQSPTPWASWRNRRPPRVTIRTDVASSSNGTISSGSRSSPGLSSIQPLHFRADSATDLPLPMPERQDGDGHRARESEVFDSQYESQQQCLGEEARQAGLERERLAVSDRRQLARRSRELALRDEEQARVERDRLAASDSRQRRRTSRQLEEATRYQAETTAAAVGESHSRRDGLQQRRIERQLDQMARERADAKAREREFAPAPRTQRSAQSSPYSTSTHSARRTSLVPTTRLPSRPGGVTVHNDPTPPRSSRPNSALFERGDDVLAQAQGRATTQGMIDAMDAINIDDDADFEEDRRLTVDVRPSGSSRSSREDRERERARRERARRSREEYY